MVKERFTTEEISRRFFDGDLGDAFQRFVQDLLDTEYADRGLSLTCYPGRGRDGGIDLVADNPEQREFLECKVSGGESPADVRAAWRKTAEHLRRNLSNSDGPHTGQSQYAPWYNTSRSIRSYTLCTTFKPANDAQRQDLSKLRGEIQDFFSRLARDHEHLRHLHDLRVEEIVDWLTIEQKLNAQKHVYFRWFPGARIIGLTPLEEVAGPEESYRAYLHSGRLPFYSQATHAKKIPPPSEVSLAEASALLGMMVPGSRDGVIVSGPGGVGKTRLTLEVAQAAAAEHWSVLRAGSRLTPERIDELADSLNPSDRVLIVFDYVETESAFPGLLEEIHNVNDSRELHICYVASSRSAFYRTTLAIDRRHHNVDLSLLADPNTADWLRGYFDAAVEHVLAREFETVMPAHRTMSGHVPALAVFLVYLHAIGRNDDLNELVEDQDFAKWVVRRLRMTFPGDVSGEVALLGALLPLPVRATLRMDKDRARILDRLTEDGWVEVTGDNADQRYEAIHDVLADEVLLHHLRSTHASREGFLDLLFSEAIRLDSLGSLLVCLERIADSQPIRETSMRGPIERSMQNQPESWRAFAATVLRMSFLTAHDKIALHERYPEAWKGADVSIAVQNAIAWMVRDVVKSGTLADDTNTLAKLIDWVEVAASQITYSNFLLTWGLRLAPERVRPAALSWLLSNPRAFQTHYVCVAWLECGLPPDLIEPAVIQWTTTNAKAPKFSFLVRAWLESGGRAAALRNGVAIWLFEHGRNEDAQFVFNAWLGATKDRELVEGPIRAWLPEHGQKEVAQFVFRAWLNATRERDLVEGAIREWLSTHGQKEDARFVFRAWLDATKDRDLVEGVIRRWLPEHGQKEGAQFVFRAWLDATKDRDLVEGAIREWLREHAEKEDANFVLRAWLDATKDRDLVEGAIREWLREHAEKEDANFVLRGWLDATRDFAFVETGVKNWLQAWRDHDDLDYVVRAWVDAGGPFQIVQDAAFRWLHKHAEEERAVYLTKSIARLPNLPTEVIHDVLRWCTGHYANEDAIWRLSQLRENLRDPMIAEPAAHSAQLIIKNILDRPTLASSIASSINTVILNLVSNPNAQFSHPRANVDDLFLRWLRHAGTISPSVVAHDHMQDAELLRRVIDLLKSRQLSVQTDRHHIERFLDWINRWTPEAKSWLVIPLRFASARFPADALWERVQIVGQWPLAVANHTEERQA